MRMVVYCNELSVTIISYVPKTKLFRRSKKTMKHSTYNVLLQ